MSRLRAGYSKLANGLFIFADFFNTAFFLVTLLIWLIHVFSTNFAEFQLSTLWTAFNGLYSRFEFKVSCIFLILYNGVISFKTLFDQIFLFFISIHRYKNVTETLRKKK